MEPRYNSKFQIGDKIRFKDEYSKLAKAVYGNIFLSYESPFVVDQVVPSIEENVFFLILKDRDKNVIIDNEEIEMLFFEEHFELDI